MSTATEEQVKGSRGVVSPGDFLWYDLMTGDAEAAQRFYGEVLGWTVTDSGLSDRKYMILHAGEKGIGGMLEKAGTKANWMGYVAVKDVDVAAEKFRKKGGAMHRAAEDLPGVGRFAVVADPEGSELILFRGNRAAPERPAPLELGTVGWQELHATDWEAAWAFYEEMFGWRKSQALDMGAAGTYQMFSTNHDEEMTGGMMNRFQETARAGWVFYFNVADINEAAERVKASGGVVAHAPSQVPGGLWVAQCVDPQGALFGMVAPK